MVLSYGIKDLIFLFKIEKQFCQQYSCQTPNAIWPFEYLNFGSIVLRLSAGKNSTYSIHIIFMDTVLIKNNCLNYRKLKN